MNAAKQALENSKDLFPQLDHQKRVIARSMRKQKVPVGSHDFKDRKNDRRGNSSDHESNKLPMQYRKRANVSTDDSNDNSKFDSDHSAACGKSQASKKRNKRKRRRTTSTSSPKIRVTPPNAPSVGKIEYSSLSDNSLSSADADESLLWIKKSEIKKMEKDLCELDDGNSNYSAQVACMKVDGTEDLSSDVESGEIA